MDAVRTRAARRQRHAPLVAFAACLGALVGCTGSAIVALPSRAATVIDDFASRASDRHVAVEARTRGWAGPPLDLAGRATALLIAVQNVGDAPLRISRDSFRLVAGWGGEFRPVLPDQIPTANRGLPARELRSTTLAPGEETSGFVYFEPVVGRWGFLHLRTTEVDADTGAVVGSLDVPFGTGHTVSCTLDSAARAWPAEAFLFRTCLPGP